MENLSKIISNLSEYKELSSKIEERLTNILVCGASSIHKSNIISLVNSDFNKQCLVITPNTAASKRLSDDINGFTGKKPLILESREFVFNNISSSSRDTAQNRIETLHKMQNHSGIIIATIDSLLQATIPPNILNSAIFKLKTGENYEIKAIISKLISAGYVRRMQVDSVSQFSVRGGILDIFPIGKKNPIRIEFFDNEIDTMAYFDIDSQRRKEQITRIEILPALEVLPNFYQNGQQELVQKLKNFIDNDFKKSRELISNIRKDIEKFENEGVFATLDRYMTMIYPETFTALDYLSSDAIVFFDETKTIIEQSKAYFKRNSEELTSLISRGIIIGKDVDYFLDFNSLLIKIRNKTQVMLDVFLQKNQEIVPHSVINITAKQLPAYSGNTEIAKDDITYYNRLGYKVIVVCSSKLHAETMLEILDGIPAKITDDPTGEVSIVISHLSSGFEYPDLKLAVITEGQILAKKSKQKHKKSNRDHVKSYQDLTIGDIVVHEHHGIGRFTGIEKMVVDGFEKDYVRIAFAGTDSLFVPATNLNLISKYIGKDGEDSKIKLNKLGGIDWIKSKIKAKKSAKDLAKYLIDLYSKRAKLQGFSFQKDDVWQQDFDNAFIYEETPDQLRSIKEIKTDMEKPIPMDRLLCGDVGFGKTEVAFRACMKCILSGKQSAILVPTTVLAKQHYFTAVKRFNGYPIKIEFISRFKTPKEQKEILMRLEEGKIDLIIGTHKLFMKGLKFKDLGLLVVDEEQRFGVSHKEKLKEFGSQIDVLTLSATPIPRTLNMALSGIRDMSVLEQAPQNRHPIETYVLEYDWNVIIDAMKRETDRNGQSFYLHNRVGTIDTVARKISEALPDAVVEVAHGQMGEAQLSKIMARMNDGEIDILVATTIIETGIDISNANTLIIENADKMGLAQLHQIRGRVGRSNRVAYAYLTYKSVLSDVATKRLSAIREFAAFGSGFKIAMRDLEIRGAGNILGSEQSGYLASIGYDLYLQLLEEAVLEEKGETPPKISECTIDISISAHISTKFIEDLGARLDLYKRIAMIKTEDNYNDMVDELIDRFGDPPRSVVNLCDIAKIKYQASTHGIINIEQKENKIIIDFDEPNIEKMSELCSKFNGKMLLSMGKAPYLILKISSGDNILKLCNQFTSEFAQIKNVD